VTKGVAVPPTDRTVKVAGWLVTVAEFLEAQSV
jgi:hypothetical protein